MSLLQTLHNYIKTVWKDAPGHKTTPMNADNLNHMENGIADAHTDIAAVAAAVDDKADKTDIATAESGTTASRAISAGTYFYLNGTLVKAKINIASGATFTLNTNYEVVTAGALNAIKEVKSVEMTATTTASGNISLGAEWVIGGGKEVIAAIAKRDSTTLLVTNASNHYYLNARHRDSWSVLQSTSINFIVFYTES